MTATSAPGFKFADNDLMGFPHQVVLGKRGLKNGTVELKDRATGEREDVAIDEVVAKVFFPLLFPPRLNSDK